MQPSVRKIGFLILAVIVLPVVVISVFEIGNLRQNEKVIQDIYRNQLDAILFSINQYSDDVISNLASRIENNQNSIRPSSREELSQLAAKPSVKCLLQFDRKYRFLQSLTDSGCDLRTKEISAKLTAMDSTVRRLETYFRGNYRKIETLESTNPHEQWIVFLVQVGDSNVINVLIIDPEKFIGEVLDPQLQQIARGKFEIAVFRKGESEPFYSSGKQYTPKKITDKKPFWLLKNYQMGIELKDVTIADLARKRVRNSMLVMGLMDFLLLAGAWLIFRNIRKQVELSQLKSDFVSNVSHEIRTPLALISMYIETLEMGRISNTEKIKEYYSVIMNETARLSGMVNRILGFSQIENNKRKYTFGKTDLNEIVEKVTLTFRYTLENKGFSYKIEKDDSLPEIKADREAVYDAIVNLIDNAMKYSADKKEITLRTGTAEGHAYAEVEDKGIGISEKNQKLIFDKFYRVTEKNLANKIKGSGLGLAIVKHIMDAHGGHIYVKSAPGSGSLFRLSFPIS
jgi:two-component system phosphate regulon sensor histidine kinase PhoR